MRRSDGAIMTSEEMESTIREQSETIRQLRIQCDQKDDYIRKLESGFTRVEAGSWESQADLDWLPEWFEDGIPIG